MKRIDKAAAAPRAGGMALLLTASFGCAITVLDANVVGVILPTVARDLHASFAEVEWVISAYVLCFASLLMPAGAVADRFGRKRVLLWGLSVFTVASLACGVAPTAPLLYLARAAQGMGAAFLLAPALAIMGHGFHAEAERARAWAIWGGIMGLTMVISPLIGGVINSLLGWRWAFDINLPVCAALFAAMVCNVDESRDPTARKLDLPGVALFAAAMFCMTWTLIGGPQAGWASPGVLARAGTSVALFVAFALVEQRRAQPMLDLSLFRTWPFVGAVAAMFAYAAAAQVMMSLLPLFLQNAGGESALVAGAAMLPFALAMLILPQVGRVLSRWMASYQILTVGLAIVAAGNFMLAFAAETGARDLLILGMAVLGSGGGLLNGETQKGVMGAVPKHKSGMASGVSTTARFSGILIGFTTLGAALADGVRASLLAQGPRLGLGGGPRLEDFIGRVAAGDFGRATALYPPAMTPRLVAAARTSYAAGFSHAFMLAGGLAAAVCLFAWITMRRSAPAREVLDAAELAEAMH